LFQIEVNRLQHEMEDAEEVIEQERLKRKTSELNLNRDLDEVERTCTMEIRKASSAHNFDTEHLKQVT